MKIKHTYFLAMFFAAACSKVKEIPTEIVPPLPYEGGALPAMTSVIGNLENIEIYKEAYKKAGIAEYIDSVRTTTENEWGEPIVTNPNTAFTLFIPKDETWEAAGYTLDKIKNLPADSCKNLLQYLAVKGYWAPDTTRAILPLGGQTLFPVIAPVLLPGEWDVSPNYYSLNLAWNETEFYLNGTKAGSITNDLHPASDGAVYLVDLLPRKAEKTVYELLQADTAYSFFLAALEISNEVYVQYNAGISPDEEYETYFYVAPLPLRNYLEHLMSIKSNFGSWTSWNNANSTVFAPENNAFRRAGLASVEAIRAFINQSYITTPEYETVSRRMIMFTNMDSILADCLVSSSLTLDHDQLLFNSSRSLLNVADRNIYTSDLTQNKRLQQEGIRFSYDVEFYDWAYFYFNEESASVEFSQHYTDEGNYHLSIQTEGNHITLHRSTAPNGRGATIVPEHSNITALNGVLHRVDNLMLPTP